MFFFSRQSPPQVLTKMYTEQILRKHEMEAFEEVNTKYFELSIN